MSKNLLDQPVRIHKSLLLRHPAAKLWYLCRAADQGGRGRVELSPEELALIKVSKSTLYRWLREGREIALFRISEFRPDGSLYVSLGGLQKACLESGMQSWGAVTTVPLREVLEGFMRALASAIQTQDLQEKSRYAAGHSLNDLERRHFKIPTADTILNLASPKMASGAVPGLIHVGADKIFVGRSFIPFGVSQERISAELNAEANSCGVCPRTLRNHLKRLGIERRQLVQAKPEYKELVTALKWHSPGYKAKGDDISFQREGDCLRLHEPNGKSSARRPEGHLLLPERFFRFGGTDWIYRCNLYELDYELTSMKRSRHEYKRLLRIKPPGEPVENSAPSKSPQTPLKEVMPSDRPAGATLGNQNKEEKNDNAQNQVPEPISPDTPDRTWWLAAWRLAGEKLKAISHQKWLKRHGL